MHTLGKLRLDRAPKHKAERPAGFTGRGRRIPWGRFSSLQAQDDVRTGVIESHKILAHKGTGSLKVQLSKVKVVVVGHGGSGMLG